MHYCNMLLVIFLILCHVSKSLLVQRHAAHTEIPYSFKDGDSYSLYAGSGIITSPNYPDVYPNNKHYVWEISAQEGFKIRLRILTLHLEFVPSCSYDYLEIRDGKIGAGGFVERFCGLITSSDPIITGNLTTITFQSDRSVSDLGFEIFYERFSTTREGCGGDIYSSFGNITSPGYPGSYPDDMTCVWIIHGENSDEIRLNVLSFALENSTNCEYSYLKISYGGFETSPAKGKFCGNNIPKMFKTEGNLMILEYYRGEFATGAGFLIQFLVVNIDPCLSNRCKHGGECVKLSSTNYLCECLPAYEGRDCQTEVNPCESNPCYHNGTCLKLSYKNYTCECPATHTGQNCVTEINPCSSNPCQNGGTCAKLSFNDYFCICPRTYCGKNCTEEKNPCETNPCFNNGTCLILPHGRYACICHPAYTGKDCTTEINLCLLNPCQNGGTCAKLSFNDYVCICPPGHLGKNCTEEANPCGINPCCNNGTCSILLDGNYACSCQPGYTGRDCTIEIDPCTSNPCQNNGICSKISHDKYICACPPSHFGINCTTEINPCESYPCYNNGSCLMMSPENYACNCRPGYTGKNCITEINPCKSNSCFNNGTCVKLSHEDYICICPPTHTGKKCLIAMNPCSVNPCYHGGTCRKLSYDNYDCICPPAYTGKDCVTEINPCTYNSCSNDTICLKLSYDNYTCICPPIDNVETCFAGAAEQKVAERMKYNQITLIFAILCAILSAVVIVFLSICGYKRYRAKNKARHSAAFNRGTNTVTCKVENLRPYNIKS